MEGSKQFARIAKSGKPIFRTRHQSFRKTSEQLVGFALCKQFRKII
jgi:hypothetical protein